MAKKQVHELREPLTPSALAVLQVGDRVQFTGRVLTARCRVYEALRNGLPSPVKLDGAALFHCAPIVVREGGAWLVRAAGASASTALATYVPALLAGHGVRVLVGNGALGEGTRKACARRGCVYLQVAAGAGSLPASSIHGVSGVYFLKEFGAADAMWQLEVEKLDTIVAIDVRGRSLHRRVAQSSRRALAELLG